MPVATTKSRRRDALFALVALTLSACGSCADDGNRKEEPARPRPEMDGGRARFFRRDELGEGGLSPAFRRALFQLDAGVSDASVE